MDTDIVYTYRADWNLGFILLDAESSYDAQKKAVVEFQAGTRKKVRGSDITIALVAKNGEPVLHDGSEF